VQKKSISSGGERKHLFSGHTRAEKGVVEGLHRGGGKFFETQRIKKLYLSDEVDVRNQDRALLGGGSCFTGGGKYLHRSPPLSHKRP